MSKGSAVSAPKAECVLIQERDSSSDVDVVVEAADNKKQSILTPAFKNNYAESL